MVLPRLHAASPALETALLRLRAELDVPADFPEEVLREAQSVGKTPPALGPAIEDRRDIDFVTVDPAGSRDLDQALAIRRAGDGYLLHYAIADVAAFVAPGGAIDAEARRRGLTFYLPDGRVPLHPPVLSEGAASLLAGQDRPAVLYEFRLAADGGVEAMTARRALVRSRRAYGYVEAQHMLDTGSADEVLVLLREVGTRRRALETARGGVSLDLPEQEVAEVDGHFELRLRAQLPVETWNAQVSLLTGMAAAGLMVENRIGILRTLPTPRERDLERLRLAAGALGHPWTESQSYAEFVRALDAATPVGAALLLLAARTLRGAGYLAFDGKVPEEHTHAAIASPYAHVTAPLRRLADRFANEVVLSLCAGGPVPAWVREALPELPEVMGDARRREGAAERGAIELVEAAELSSYVGETLDGVVVAVDDRGSTVQLREPVVEARVAVELPLATAVRVKVDSVDVATAAVDLQPVGPPSGLSS